MTTNTLHPASSRKDSAGKPSRLSAQAIAFVKTALTSNAAEKLDPRDRRYLAHVVGNPQLTFQELASFASIRTRQGAHRIWKAGLHTLWMASPPDIQNRYPLAKLLNRRHGRFRSHTPQTRAKLRAAQLGKKVSPETLERYRQAQRGKRHSVVARERMRASQLKRWKLRKQQLAA